MTTTDIEVFDFLLTNCPTPWQVEVDSTGLDGAEYDVLTADGLYFGLTLEDERVACGIVSAVNAYALAREYVEAKEAHVRLTDGWRGYTEDERNVSGVKLNAAYEALAQAVGKRGNDEPTK